MESACLKAKNIRRTVYLGFKLVLVPIAVISGIIYMFHKTIDRNEIVVVRDISLESIAFWHTLGAILLMVFLVIHVYMTTTGHTPTSNIRAMITGYEDLEEEVDETAEREGTPEAVSNELKKDYRKK